MKALKLFFLLIAAAAIVGMAFNLGGTEGENPNLLLSWLVVFVAALLCTMLTTKKLER